MMLDTDARMFEANNSILAVPLEHNVVLTDVDLNRTNLDRIRVGCWTIEWLAAMMLLSAQFEEHPWMQVAGVTSVMMTVGGRGRCTGEYAVV